MAKDDTATPSEAAYQAPPEWAELTRMLVPSAVSDPRVIVSQSRGKFGYHTTLDVRLRRPSRVVRPDGTEIVALEVPGSPPGDAIDVANFLWANAVETFLTVRKANEARVKQGRIQLAVYDGDRELGAAGKLIRRDSFEDDEAEFFDQGQNPELLGLVRDAMRMVSGHAKSLGDQFVKLTEVTGKQASDERAGLLEYARGALGVVKEAGEIHSAAVARAAEADAMGGAWGTPAGQAVMQGIADNLNIGAKIGLKLLERKLGSMSE